MTHVTYPKMVA